MWSRLLRVGALAITLALLAARPAHATDVDGPDDCQRSPVDFGDAPEGVQAYSGVIGAFPTCLTPGPIGTHDVPCLPISTFPGPAGFVRHVHSAAAGVPYWLGCNAGPIGPWGIDGEPDGKMNDTGATISACSDATTVDCSEAFFGLTFGQDECYGTDDAALTGPFPMVACQNGTVTFEAYNCATFPRDVRLNILVDFNHDGDWNDNFQCAGACAYEWAVKNVVVTLAPGCNVITSPAFRAGPTQGEGWMRITICDEDVPDDFPWNGSAGTANQQFRNGETEDYPVRIDPPTEPCPSYEDWGDAPEEVQAYLGIAGHFPTCMFTSGPGTHDVACPAISTPPGLTGYVRHVTAPGDQVAFWLGCGDAAAGTNGVDGEVNGKTNDTGAPVSICATPVGIDCVEPAFGMSFGQDECYADPSADQGINAAITFAACATSTVTFDAFNCHTQVDAFLNILVDWNQDGDWNDNFICPGTGACAYEWAVKNVPIPLAPGCQTIVSPAFQSGPFGGRGWLRITLTAAPVNDDFPWNGSAPPPAGGPDFFRAGETEDYPVTITPPDTCEVGYTDFGDAPEDLLAYPSGILGHFPTCIAPSAAGTQTILCGTAQSSAPGLTGFVQHVQPLAGGPEPIWLGCQVDGEADGKVNLNPVPGTPSVCNDAVLTDCVEPVPGITFGQDECYLDPEAAISSQVQFTTCYQQLIRFKAFNCATVAQQAFLNVLVDWNQDGDWNDNVSCPGGSCAYEWAVKNVPITLVPGCYLYNSPAFRIGPNQGMAWMRVTLSFGPVPNDFPWNGSVSLVGQVLSGGETEDYPVQIGPPTTGIGDRPAPDGLWLAAPAPNPGSEGSLIRFAIPQAATVSLTVHDLAGRKLADLVGGRLQAGEHPVRWDFRDATGSEVPVGFYLIKLRVGDIVLTRRLVRIK
jgi:hypothetical protein